MCTPSFHGSKDFMEAFHALWLADWAESVTITGIDLHGERSMDLKEVYLVPITGRRVLSVKDHFPQPRRKCGTFTLTGTRPFEL